MYFRVRDICDINLNNLSKSHEWKYINYLDTANLNESKIDKIQTFLVGKDKIPSRAKRLVNINDILISTVRPNQKHYGILKSLKKNMVVSTGFAVLTCKEDIVYSEYLYWFLTQESITLYLQGIAETSTSTYPSIKPSVIGEVKIELPPLKEQKAIANILSILDEKIETNNKINKNLEAMAQEIFKHWFVDFEFPDENGNPYKSSGGEMVESEMGMIPKEWKIAEIKDYAEVKSGYAFKSAWWKENGVKVLKITNISSGKLTIEDCSYVEVERIPKESRYIAYPSDLLIALTGATLGKMSIIPKLDEKLLVNQRVGKFIYKNKFKYPLPFLYCLLQRADIISELIDRGQGSAQPNIGPTELGKIKILLPINKIINMFNEKLKPFFEYYIYSYKQNQQLAQLRDTLLPKLMSGEIRLPLE